jgi:hypothetical protein
MSQFLELCGLGRRLFGDLATHRSNGEGQSDAILLWHGIVNEPVASENSIHLTSQSPTNQNMIAE